MTDEKDHEAICWKLDELAHGREYVGEFREAAELRNEMVGLAEQTRSEDDYLSFACKLTLILTLLAQAKAALEAGDRESRESLEIQAATIALPLRSYQADAIAEGVGGYAAAADKGLQSTEVLKEGEDIAWNLRSSVGGYFYFADVMRDV